MSSMPSGLAPDDFEDRLEAARALVDALRQELPAAAHERDQSEAAIREASLGALRLAEQEPWTLSVGVVGDEAQQREIAARIIVVLEQSQQCPHLLEVPAQPAVARLELRRVDCRRCLQTAVNPPPGVRCGWCGATDVESLTRIALQPGAVLVVGEACDGCLDALRPPGAVTA